MTTQQMTFQIPPYGTATLTLPERLTPDAFVCLDTAISQALGEQRRALGDRAGNDPGSIQCDSWSVHQH